MLDVDLDKARALLDAPRPAALAAVGGKAPDATWTPHLDRVLLELRERGLSVPAVVVVFDLYEGVEVTADQVRYRLRALGVPKCEAKARAMRERHARQRAT